MELSGSSYELPGTVSAVFFSKKDAQKAHAGLLRLGHSQDEISLLMSDETLNSHANPLNEENALDVGASSDQARADQKARTRHLIADAILSITTMISLPKLGIWISRRLLGDGQGTFDATSIGSIIAARIPQEHCDTYEAGIKEGGIIISVDPKNRAERDAIVREFRASNGHDILGDDGYTELGD
ncbi:hypothetical protein [Dyadobacter pollutisoli]|uniref:Uncharacterized protein n=1 Tax=Dyadobacter pollutisoli TaxID=2910158 RepID=A0A9E8NDU7_9BACT|nr:hypothetical protein [Dyadobacter pollutisoli]WAC13483.1 hypothetical protein ON006_05895 [Dyadobacter pollutisoli]